MSPQPEQEDSEFLRKEPCPKCSSKDNLARYSDGHGHCFGCGHYEPASEVSRKGKATVTDSDEPQAAQFFRKPSALIEGEYRKVEKRKLSEDTCRLFGYQQGKHGGKFVQIANYRSATGVAVAQKIRYASKDFTVLGKPQEALPLYGQHLWPSTGRRAIVTEGEIDAMSVSQAQGNKWPVVSVPNGAQGAAKAVRKAMDWLLGFDEVVFMFDMDEPGQEAAIECASLLPPGTAKIATLPLKDANEMLVAGREEEIVQAAWRAKVHRPDGLVTMSELREEMLDAPIHGLPWPFPSLTKATYGRFWGQVIMLGAGTGVGKTDLFTQIVADTLVTHRQAVAIFFLEQSKVEASKRIAGKVGGARFHVPDAGWTQEEFLATLDDIDSLPPVHIYDSWGSTEWDIIKQRIDYLAQAEGVKHFFIDHLTALAASESDERTGLERIMAEVASLAQRLQIVIYMISHLSTPEGKPHEEGGRVMIRHFKGSRAIGFWSHFMFALERDQQHEDPEIRQQTTLRILKDRFTGQSTGTTITLKYDVDTGLLYEGEAKAEDESGSYGFKGAAGEDHTDF